MKNLIVLCLFLLPLFSNAQKSHTVAAKESLYSIGRLYNVHPKELAAYNNIPFEEGLVIGQVLKIPVKKSMAPLENTPATPEPVAAATVTNKTGDNPLYHQVQAKEGLYSISKKYNVSIAQIKQWNNLDSDNIEIGTNLVVGYSKVAPVEQQSVPVQKKEPVIKKDPVVKKEAPAAPAEVIPEEEPVTKAPVEAVKNTTPPSPQGSFFKQSYDNQVSGKTVSNETGMAGIFKSTSGWEDGKFYCLHNNAPAGSFVKITNPRTQKSVYAKVLDLMPDLKQNSNYVIRISNAAAAALGDDGSDFECTVSY